MDPFTSVFTVAQAFKEVYLLARFVYKTVSSASHYQEEERKLIVQFKIELLHYKSFWAVFTRGDGNLIDDDTLNQEWLKMIMAVVRELHLCFVDYAKIAAQNDTDYREYSPYHSQSSPCAFPGEDEALGDATRSLQQTGRPWFSKLLFKSVAHSAARAVDGGRWRNEGDLLTRFAQTNDPAYAMFESHIALREIAQDPEAAAVRAKALPTIKDISEPTPRQLVEQKFFDQSTPETEQYVAQLAMLLSTAGSNNFRTLPFKGYLKGESEPSYMFCFGYPTDAADTPPQSLHQLIKNDRSKNKAALSTRFHIAQKVARSVGAFHSDGWVHKSIRSHAVKFFFDNDSPENVNLNSPYLTDFEFSRPHDGFTGRAEGDPDLERSIYRHPDRDGPPSVNFNKAHDIYSLGIVLLEIGLWEDAVSSYHNVCRSLEKRSEGRHTTSVSVKKAMKEYASLYLPHKMGNAYSEAVKVCLSDDFLKKLGHQDFALTFERKVVDMLDVKKLCE